MLESYKNLVVWQKSIDLVQEAYILTGGGKLTRRNSENVERPDSKVEGKTYE
ncbi:MAG: hypothetical protein Q7R86_01310 [bacterium]|nr:hypothetical protein [bacterium]